MTSRSCFAAGVIAGALAATAAPTAQTAGAGAQATGRLVLVCQALDMQRPDLPQLPADVPVSVTLDFNRQVASISVNAKTLQGRLDGSTEEFHRWAGFRGNRPAQAGEDFQGQINRTTLVIEFMLFGLRQPGSGVMYIPYRGQCRVGPPTPII